MTKAEFTPVANALESNIDAALARIRELEARLAEAKAQRAGLRIELKERDALIAELRARMREAEALRAWMQEWEPDALRELGSANLQTAFD